MTNTEDCCSQMRQSCFFEKFYSAYPEASVYGILEQRKRRGEEGEHPKCDRYQYKHRDRYPLAAGLAFIFEPRALENEAYRCRYEEDRNIYPVGCRSENAAQGIE